MWQTLLFLLFQGLGAYITVQTIKSQNLISNIKNTSSNELIKGLYSVGLLIPLLEEALFRYISNQLFSGFIYCDLISSILFGLAHIQNYMVNKNKLAILFQVIATSYLGYYIIQFDSFWYGFMIHAYYNIGMMMMAYGYILYAYKEYNDDNGGFDFYLSHPMVFVSSKTCKDDNKFKNKELINIDIDKLDYTSIYADRMHLFDFCSKQIHKDKIPKDMMERIEKLQKIKCNKKLIL